MASLSDMIAAAWRDFNTDGVPASGAHDPAKSDIRALETAIVQAVQAAASGMTSYATKAALLAAPAPAAGTQARVYGDSTSANNGVYVYRSGAWAIDSDYYAFLATFVQASVNAAAASAAAAANSASAIPLPANDKSEKLLKPYVNIYQRTGSNPTFNADGTVTGGSGGTQLVYRYALTTTQIASGKVTIDFGGAPGAPTVQQTSASFATNVGSAAAIPALGSRYQLQVTLDPSTTGLVIGTGTIAAGATSSGPSVTVGTPVDAPDTGEFYSALGREAAKTDARQVLGVPVSVANFTGSTTAGTINADGTVTIPANSAKFVTIPFKAGYVPSLTTNYYAVVDTVSGVLGQLNQAHAMTPYDPDGAVNAATVPLDKTLGTRGVFVSGAMSLACGSSANKRAAGVFIAVYGGAADAVVRIGLYEGAVPSFPFVGKDTQDAITSAVAAIPVNAIQAGGAARVDLDNQARKITVQPDDFLIEQAHTELILAMGRVAGGKAVSLSGNDTAAGTTTAPLATLAAAYVALPSGGTIGLRNGQYHRYDASTNYRRVAYELVGYGQGDFPATIDFRQHLPQGSGFWTATGDGGWTATVTHRQATIQPTSSAVTTYKLFRDLNALTWQYGSDVIATNEAAAKAAKDSFAVHKSGSTHGDPWNAGETSGTSYVYTVYLSDGADPNTLDMSIQDTDYFELGPVSNVATFGLAGKDHTHTDAASGTLLTGTPLPVLHNKTSIDVNIHGHVGPCSTTGRFKASGKGRAARTGGLEMFPGGHPTEDSTHDTIESYDAQYAVYCHSTTSPVNTEAQPFFKSLHIKRVEGARNMALLEFIRSSGPCCPGAITIDEVYLLAHSGYLLHANATGGQSVNGGYVEFLSGGYFAIGGGTPMNFRNLKFRTFATAFGNTFYIANGGSGTILFQSCEDQSDPRHGVCMFGNNTLNKHDLVIDASLMWDLQPLSTTDYLPMSLTVKAGSRFGWGGRTRQGIRDYFTAKGVTCSIDNNTTIVNQYGSVIDTPTS